MAHSLLPYRRERDGLSATDAWHRAAAGDGRSIRPRWRISNSPKAEIELFEQTVSLASFDAALGDTWRRMLGHEDHLKHRTPPGGVRPGGPSKSAQGIGGIGAPTIVSTGGERKGSNDPAATD